MKIWNVVCAGLLLVGTGVFAEEILVSWESNGVLVAAGMEPGSTCTVERASSYDISSTRGLHPSYDVGGNPHTSPAGSFSANGYGLYDMSGNVWEWCNTTLGSNRGFRGGCWYDLAYDMRCGGGAWLIPDFVHFSIGFRAVCR
jgi:hypothetical protein